MLGGKLIERKKLNSDLGALVDGWCWFLLYDSVETIFVIYICNQGFYGLIHLGTKQRET